MKKALIIAAHPDDDILGCGGVISKYKEKVDFKIIFIAEGSSCRYPFSEIKNPNTLEVIELRNSFAIKALKSLGVHSHQFYNLPCGRLDQVPIIQINKIIEEEIQIFQPDTIFTHSYEDTNNDHRIVHRATQMATRPGIFKKLESVFSYEVLSSSEWRFSEVFKPNYFESLSDNDIENKWLALNEYASEIKNFPFPRSKDGIYTLAKYRGLQCSHSYAEAFKLIRKFVR